MSNKPAPLISGLDPAALFDLGTDPVSPEIEWQPPSLEEMAKLFPQWQVLRLLGRGDMGAVYEMRQPESDSPVAVKLLPIEAGRDENLVERFHREARALAKLSHPGIVALLESGVTSAGHLFLMMEHVGGSPLSQWITEGRLNVTRAIDIMRQVCEALTYAHGQGVIHRDLKPSNILLDPLGRVKVADFGLAYWQRAADQPSMTLAHTGNLIGTSAYAAPELVRDAARVDHRADIYALGVLLYEMLTGDLPRGVFQPPSRKAGSDARLDDVVRRAMQERPEARYQKVSDLRDAIARAQVRALGKQPEARQTGRSVFKAAGLSLLLLGVAGIVLASWWGIWRMMSSGGAGRTPSSGEAPALSSGAGLGGRESDLKGQGSGTSSPADNVAAPKAVPSQSMKQAPKVSIPPPPLANGAKVHVWSVAPVAPGLYPPQELTTHDWRDAALTLHGGAALLEDGSVVVWDENTPGQEHRIALAKPVSNLAATPSEVVARSKDGQVYLLPRDGQGQPRLLASNVTTLFPSAKSGQMLFCRRDGTPWLLSLSGDAEEPAQMARYQMDPALIAADGSLWGISSSGQILTRKPSSAGFEVQASSISELAAMGSRIIALGADDGKVLLFNTEDQAPDGMSGFYKVLAVDGMALAFSRELKALLWGPKVEDSPQRFELPERVVYVRLGPTGLLAAW